MRFRNKEYKVVIWDWLWTLYSRRDERLFKWVMPYFESSVGEANNFLVSYAYNPSKRVKLIEGFNLDKYFKDIVVSVDKKEVMYKVILEKYGYKKEDVLVIGDNVLHEGRAAKELGLDFIPIAVWDEFVYTNFPLSRSKEN
jgi:methionine salvage enolase-phosphatase E1